MLNHIGTDTIITKRLVLRRFIPEDASDMYSNWAGDSNVTKYLMWKAHANVEVTNNIVNDWCESYSDRSFYHWAIIPVDFSKVIGSITVSSISETYSNCELGYCLGREFWGKGIMTEALKSILTHLFSNVGFRRIYAAHDTENEASGRVLLKAGMTPEGTLRKSRKYPEGNFFDCRIYSILKEEI